MRTLLVLVLLTTALLPRLAAEDIPLIDPAEPAKGWRSGNGAEFPGAKVALAADPATTKDGKPSLRLTADLSGGGNYCDMSREVKDLKLEVESVSFWLKAPGLDGLGMRLIDGGGRCHQISLNLAPATDDWRLVSFPISRFFEKRGTAEAVQGVARYESWGGPKGQPDGWSGQLQAFILLCGRQKKSTDIWVSDLVASVRPGTTAWSCGFEGGIALPAGWRSEGATTIATQDAFAGANALVLARDQAGREKPCSAASPAFPVAPGTWEISAALAVDLESPDASYCGSLHFEAIDAAGKVVETTEIATPYGRQPWQVVTKQVRTPFQTAAGRLVMRINKTIGSYRIDALAARPLDTAKRLPAVERIVLTSGALGNLLLPDAARTWSLRVEATRELAEAERTLAWTVRDYWGAEIAAPATVAIAANGKNKGRFRYEAAIDLAALPLETGRYYELHAQVPLADNEPVRNSAGFAILPTAASKAFPPAKIPFTARNWDNRLGDYISLADRLGVRIIGLWGGTEAKPPFKAWAPGIEQCAKQDCAILTGIPNLSAIEYHHQGWEQWTDEATIRGSVRSWFAAYGGHQPKPIVVSLGNEPHGTGEQVRQQVAAYTIAYDEIKKVAPDAIVVATSVEPNEAYFQAGYGAACDAFDFHVYETPDSVRQSIRDYQALMRKYGCVKPIWSTEIGLNSQGLTRQHISGDMVRKFAAFFAAGGVNIGWFDYLYPDPDGKALGTSGDSFNMFDSRYGAYAARLDAVCCYNLMNGILDKGFAAERTWPDGTYACLFRNPAGACFALLWRDQGRSEVFLPLPGVKTVALTRIDGRRSLLQAGGAGIGLGVGPDPVLLAYDGPANLPERLGEAPLRIAAAPARLMRGTPGIIELAGSADPKLVSLSAPAGWTVARTGDKPLRFTVTSPEASQAREGDLIIRLADAAGATVAETGVRPVLTGQLAIEIRQLPATAGGRPTAQLVVSNQSPQAQTVTWALVLASERALVSGAWAAPVKSSAYLAEAGNGSLSIAPRSQAQVAVPLASTAAGRMYQLHATITDATGGVIATDADLKP